MGTPAKDSLLRSLRWLKTSHEYSDLKIFCGNEVFPVHKAIVCPRSRYFATSCKWGKDGKLKDEIVLEEEDSRLIGLMIDYLYCMDYDDLLPVSKVIECPEEAVPTPESPVARTVSFFETLDNNTVSVQESATDPVREHEPIEISESSAVEHDDWNVPLPPSKSKKSKKKAKPQKTVIEDTGGDVNTARLTVNALMYALADRFEIEDLKAQAKTKFEQAVLQDWKSQAFAHAAELAFNNTPSSDAGIRTIVVGTINQHRELVDCEEIRNLLESGNGMAWALVQVLLADAPTRANPWGGFRSGY